MEERNSKPAQSVPDVKRAFMDLLREMGMDPETIKIISKLPGYKVQTLVALYQAYTYRQDFVKEKARQFLERDLKKESVREMLNREENRPLWDKDSDEESKKRFIDFAIRYYQKMLILEFSKTLMHEYMNTLGSSFDKTLFVVSSEPDKVTLV